MALSKKKKLEREARRNELLKAISKFKSYALEFDVKINEDEALAFLTNPKTQKNLYSIVSHNNTVVSMWRTGSLFSYGAKNTTEGLATVSKKAIESVKDLYNAQPDN